MTTAVAAPARFFGSATLAQNENSDPYFGLDLTADGQPPAPEPFWKTAGSLDIQKNWNKLFPYQLLFLRKQGREHKIIERFTLPIPPQALSISTPFAITTSVTMGGVLEEHNGAPLRMITLAGTTGVLPLRGTVARSQLLDAIPSIFAGTVTAVNQISTAASQAGNLLGVDRSGSVNANTDTDLAATTGGGVGTGFTGTGFHQFQLLKRFLEAYAAMKRAGDKDLRLGFAVWKEQEVYLVTPVSFDVPRTAQSPLEYPFNLSMKAWRRIVIKDQQAAGSFEGHVGASDPNKLAQVINALETGRRVLEGARNVLEGIRADIQNVLFTPLRQTLLGVKDAVGTILTAVDLPTNIISDLKEPMLEAAATANAVQTLGRTGQRFQQNLDASVNSIQEAFRQLAISTGKADTQAGAGTGSNPPPAGKSGGALFGGPGRQDADPANKVSANPTENFAFFSTVRPSDLNLRPDTIRRIEAERAAARQLRRQDYERFRDQALRVMADFADFVGAGDETYTRIFGLPVRTTERTPTDDDFAVMDYLSGIAQQYDSLAATTTVNRDQVTAMDYVAGLATRSGIAFQVPRSKFAVPFPHGYTLEKLADKYLGDANRWHEVAVLNGLRAPFVDEVGFKLTLLTNGIGNQIIVADGSNLFVGQLVYLASNSVRRESRRIQGLVQPVPGQTVVQLDGDPDLDRFTTVGLSYLQSFLPGTVNSQQQLYIPSDTEPDEEDFRTKSIPGVDYFDPLVRSGGIDLLLTQSGDLVITPDGDSRLAIGLPNLIQKARLVLGTPRGALLHHPDYGIGLKPGVSTADLSADDVFRSIQQFFREDQGYTGVSGVAIRKSGNGMTVKMSVGIAGTGQFIPITVDIRR